MIKNLATPPKKEDVYPSITRNILEQNYFQEADLLYLPTDKFASKGVEGLMTFSLEFDKYWRNGKNTEIGNEIALFNPTEYDNDVHVKDQTKGFNNFKIYLMPTNKIEKPRRMKKKPERGADIFNKND